jgi:RNA polymerase primary sigma factor
LVDKISKMRRTAMKLQEVFGREPTDEELAEEMGMSALARRANAHGGHPPRLAGCAHWRRRLEQFRRGGAGRKRRHPYEQLEEKTVTKMLREMVKTLDPREATILQYRFGLDGGSEKTLEEVGAKFGVTRERVRQIQNIALNKLRRMIEKLEAVKT